jgi:hypothetical protein
MKIDNLWSGRELSCLGRLTAIADGLFAQRRPPICENRSFPVMVAAGRYSL